MSLNNLKSPASEIPKAQPSGGCSNSPCLRAIPLNTSEIDQSLLNIEKKSRSNLFPWNGQFSPQLIEVLLEKYAPRGSIVLDPFAGSGTILCECGGRQLEAVAIEINPSACCMARIYQLTNYERPERLHCLWEVGRALRSTLFEDPPLFTNQEQNFHHDGSLLDDLRRLSHDLTSPNARVLFEALVVLLDLYKPGLDQRRIMSTWNRLVSNVQRLPYSEKSLKVINADARSIPIEGNSVDIVITSPPYINVFNYHQQYRASAEFLGWNLLNVAKCEIGANRKYRTNRFLTVVQYCLDIHDVLLELKRVCAKSARIIFVVGRQSRVRNTPFFNGEIVAELGMRCAGFELRTRQERVFTNKFGEQIFEDILHFVIPERRSEDKYAPALVAQRALEAALLTASTDVAGDIEDALNRICEVTPSPLYGDNK